MRSFVLVMEEFPEISRQQIDIGAMRREAITLVDCVRSSLFTSHGVRKDVNVVVYPLEPGGRLIRIDGEKLRFMGPDERSISILLSMSAERLMSRRVGNEVSSPGVTIVNKGKPSGRINGNSLVLSQSSEGSDLRRITFVGSTTYVCALDGEWRFGDIGSFVNTDPPAPIAVKSAGQIEKTILMMNNEIDRQLGNERTKI